MNKKIWMCWFQGEDDNSLSGLNRKCINRWKELNPTWQVNVLSNKTISDYVPEYFEIIKNSPSRKRPACSDLLRILLLSKYGGVWVDASVYPMQPLSDFYGNIVNNTGFFSYRFVPRGSYNTKQGLCEIVSWFLCVDRPNHYIIEKWKTKFITKFKNSKHWKYFAFHQTLTDLYDEDEQVRYIIENMVQIDEKIPHSALNGWDNKKPSYTYKRPRLP
tara:strand:+ start:53 stop:703 length:651 start_codon:yes stop_codon:yes gene_type:complete